MDLGGGTFDVALLESIGGNEYNTLMVDGNRSLGGDDFTKAVVELMMSEIQKSIGVDLSTREKSRLSEIDYTNALQKLYTEAVEHSRRLKRRGILEKFGSQATLILKGLDNSLAHSSSYLKFCLLFLKIFAAPFTSAFISLPLFD